MSDRKTIDAWEESPIPISPVGQFKRELIALCRDGLRWRESMARKRVDHPEQVCPTCGKAHKPRRKTRKYCSTYCRVKAHRKGVVTPRVRKKP